MVVDDNVVIGQTHGQDDPESVPVGYLLGVEALRAVPTVCSPAAGPCGFDSRPGFTAPARRCTRRSGHEHASSSAPT
jgi:hypothetical protein